MKKIKIKLNKRMIIILTINIILFIGGLLYPSLISKTLISTKITNYIESLLNSKYTINSLIKANILNNLFDNSSMYIFTLFLFTFPIILIIYFIKVFSLLGKISALMYEAHLLGNIH